MEELLLNIRYALRVLWKSPAFTLMALSTLVLGIGANVVVFGIVNAVLLHPLDVSDPQNLYQFRLKPRTSFKLLTTSYPAYEDFRRQNTTFSGVAGFNGYSNARLTWGSSVRSVAGYAVTGNYFELLGVQPEVGRFFQDADEHGPNSAPYVERVGEREMEGEAAWQRLRDAYHLGQPSFHSNCHPGRPED